jgi:hypothetical protein
MWLVSEHHHSPDVTRYRRRVHNRHRISSKQLDDADTSFINGDLERCQTFSRTVWTQNRRVGPGYKQHTSDACTAPPGGAHQRSLAVVVLRLDVSAI